MPTEEQTKQQCFLFPLFPFSGDCPYFGKLTGCNPFCTYVISCSSLTSCRSAWPRSWKLEPFSSCECVVSVSVFPFVTLTSITSLSSIYAILRFPRITGGVRTPRGGWHFDSRSVVLFPYDLLVDRYYTPQPFSSPCSQLVYFIYGRTVGPF